MLARSISYILLIKYMSNIYANCQVNLIPKAERSILTNNILQRCEVQWRNATAGGPPSIGHFRPPFAPLKIG